MNAKEAFRTGIFFLAIVVLTVLFFFAFVPALEQVKANGQESSEVGYQLGPFELSRNPWVAFSQLWVIIVIIPILGSLGLILVLGSS